MSLCEAVLIFLPLPDSSFYLTVFPGRGTSIPKSVHVKVSLQYLLKSVWIHWMHYNEARRAFKPEQEHVEHATTYNYLMVTQLCYFPPHDEQQGFKHLLKFMMAKNDINNHQYWYF